VPSISAAARGGIEGGPQLPVGHRAQLTYKSAYWADRCSLGMSDRERIVAGRITVSSPLHTLPLLMAVHDSMGQRVGCAHKRASAHGCRRRRQ
jgi:hypothetical protein